MDFIGITAEKNGTFSYRIKKTLPSGEKLDTKIRGFATKREAKAARDKRLAELGERFSKSAKKRIRYDQLYSEFLINEAENNRKYATLQRYNSLHKTHISPIFGERWIDGITPGEVNRFLRELKATGKSYGYIDSFFKQMSTVFKYAINNQYLSASPMTAVTMPLRDISEAHAQEEQVKILSAAETDILVEKLENTNSQTPFLLGYYMGLRVSETYALRWSDIDFEGKMLRVDKQLQYQNYTWCLVPPKSFKGYRTIEMPDALAEYLKHALARREQNMACYGKAYKKNSIRLRLKPRQDETAIINDFVCVKRGGGLLTPSSSKYISQTARLLGIDSYRYHILRHTHASQLANSNVSALALKERLGHEKVDTTWSLYSHVSREAEEKLSQALNSVHELRCAD